MKNSRSIILAAIIIVFIIYPLFFAQKNTKIDYQQLNRDLQEGLVKVAILQGDKLQIEYFEEKKRKTFAYLPRNEQEQAQIIKLIKEKVEKFDVIPEPSAFSKFISFMFPLFIIWIIFSFMRRGAGSSAGGLFGFGKSKARMIIPKANGGEKTTFKDVAGVEEAKEELGEIIEFLREPLRFTKLGGKIPKGVLLMGPPGTGKTLLAKAVAGEAGVPFFSISGSEFVEMFVGVGAARVRDLFTRAQAHAPCIVFVDEIDALGKQRGVGGIISGHDEREQTLNQMLAEMDGFDSSKGVIIIAATNRPEVLDQALVRSGRFDRQIVVPLPDLKGREGILKVHTRKVPLADDINLEDIARGTPGFSGADLANIVNEAALLAARRNAEEVSQTDFESAKDKILLGTESKHIISLKEKKRTAVHESGHVLAAVNLPHADPIHKVSIIPRGRALGVTQQLPTEDRYNLTKQELEARIMVLLGGRVAEKEILGIETVGAANDLERATEIIDRMVCEFGMSNLGPLTFTKNKSPLFLQNIIQQRELACSESMSQEIDKEKKRIIEELYANVKEIIGSKKEKLEKLADVLLEKETLSSQEINAILNHNSPKAL